MNKLKFLLLALIFTAGCSSSSKNEVKNEPPPINQPTSEEKTSKESNTATESNSEKKEHELGKDFFEDFIYAINKEPKKKKDSKKPETKTDEESEPTKPKSENP